MTTLTPPRPDIHALLSAAEAVYRAAGVRGLHDLRVTFTPSGLHLAVTPSRALTDGDRDALSGALRAACPADLTVDTEFGAPVERGNEDIADLPGYLRDLRGSLPDKRRVCTLRPGTQYLDYGCADGSLLAELAPLHPGAALCGYDLSPVMVQAARTAHPEVPAHTTFTRAFAHLVPGVRRSVVLSSVIHEVLSRSTPEQQAAFWVRVSLFDQVIIRDMAVTGDADGPPDAADAEAVRRVADPRLLAAFEARYGPVTGSRRALAHFMLKARYPQNFEAELDENYLALSVDHLSAHLSGPYETAHRVHRALPFLDEEARRVYGVGYPCATHLELILERPA
ncbi:class I SAM-dependent methyltransferase [Deinococcus soli (ex Cha et al. 2016)]|uniref:SAM-dependent methyltransferase n=2 Tax=Deinococcus soli (ex Cha et al. 2016) TaxID=1309411 RepID=A0AAE3XDT3_9DEIO|nr:class I SAM-dependent methyltransferase [Deinococcus soli (ex Cha et al. 2016)]MDR6218657.1 SAM-dependent methyltransferase [Deinococcus soli (ex Cha et al. 2016)]MDR6328454.1 SAM-dependent methyltransferase [Deinococcus soli (ex Cha et al. 2016)]MDR6753065.1 SAM-dependent methyltransferase [Deinococcus soli (ex Cha et al. 2016)]